MKLDAIESGDRIIGPSGNIYQVTAVQRVGNKPTGVIAICRDYPDGSGYTTVMLDRTALRRFEKWGTK